jgi:hypothetical protein
MFYCDKCGLRNGWPTDFWLPQSAGGCEICHRVTVCYDVPSKHLATKEPTTPERQEGGAVNLTKRSNT